MTQPSEAMIEAANRVENLLRDHRRKGANPDDAMFSVKGSDLRRLLAAFHFPNANWDALRSLTNDAALPPPAETGGLTDAQVKEAMVQHMVECMPASRLSSAGDDELVARLLSPVALEAAAREIEPELGCWKPNASKEWDWRKRQEMKVAERILRAVIEALSRKGRE